MRQWMVGIVMALMLNTVQAADQTFHYRICAEIESFIDAFNSSSYAPGSPARP